LTEFSLMTWNGFGAGQSVASFFRWKGVADAHRFEHPDLIRAVREVDVLCIQEVFLSEAEGFFERLPHPHKIRDHNRTSWYPLSFTGSGLGVASRMPFVKRAMRAFPPPYTGADRFARKGMLHVRLRLEDDGTLDVISCHLQSGMGRRAPAIRGHQLRELRRFIDEVAHPHGAVIVCGDLNVDGSAAGGRVEYAELLRALHGFVDLGAEADAATFHPHPEVNPLAHRFYASEGPQRLDYVLFRPGRTPVQIAEISRALDRPLLPRNGETVTFPSDHFALRARFRLR